MWLPDDRGSFPSISQPGQDPSGAAVSGGGSGGHVEVLPEAWETRMGSAWNEDGSHPRQLLLRVGGLEP